MRKNFLRCSLIAGITASTFVLASCGGKTQVKDADGKTYDIVATEDPDTVAKAYLLSTYGISTNKNTYATEVGYTYKSNLHKKYSDVIEIDCKNEFSGKVAYTIGNEPYKTYEPTETGYTEEQINEATATLRKNLGLIFDLKSETSYSNLTYNEEAIKAMPSSEMILGSLKKFDASKKATFDSKVFLSNGDLYIECNQHTPKELAIGNGSLPEEDMDLSQAYTYKPNYMVAPALCTGYANLGSMEYIEQTLSSVNPSFGVIKYNEEYFKSDAYKNVVDAIKAVGLKIADVNNDKIKFEVELTGAETNKLLSDSLKMEEICKPEEVVLKSSFVIDTKNARFESSEATLQSFGVVKALSQQLMNYTDNIPVFGQYLKGILTEFASAEITGSATLKLTCKYDSQVNISAKPDENKTYTELPSLFNIL